MKVVNVQEWTDDKDDVLLRKQQGGKFYIPLSTVSLETLKQLRLAIENIEAAAVIDGDGARESHTVSLSSIT